VSARATDPGRRGAKISDHLGLLPAGFFRVPIAERRSIWDRKAKGIFGAAGDRGLFIIWTAASGILSRKDFLRREKFACSNY
jgi:hypothetical protein